MENEMIKQFARQILGDNPTEETDTIKTIASGDESKGEAGIIHTWFIDGAAASFAGIAGGVQWELIACDLDDIESLIEWDEEEDAEGAIAKLDYTGAKYMTETEMWVRIW